jgi:hypothetical protein
MQSRSRELNNPNVGELEDRHPATGRDLNGADKHDVGGLDPVLPDNPAIITFPASRIWCSILSVAILFSYEA